MKTALIIGGIALAGWGLAPAVLGQNNPLPGFPGGIQGWILILAGAVLLLFGIFK